MSTRVLEFQVGDRVGFCRWHQGEPLFEGFSRVAKINRWGHILLENGRQYNKWGGERDAIAGTQLIAADRLERVLADRNQRRTRLRQAQHAQNLLAQYQKQGGMLSDADFAQLVSLVTGLAENKPA